MRGRATRVALVAALLAGACSDDGRELRPPSAQQTTTAPTTSTLAPTLTFASSAVAAGEAIPVEFTCDGANTSPPLEWSGVPQGTAELGIVVTDPDARGFVHWVAAGIDAGTRAVGAGGLPEGSVEARNDAGTIGYTGPCPPPGAPHTYVFSLFALRDRVALDPDLPPLDAAARVQERAISTATFTATYARS